MDTTTNRIKRYFMKKILSIMIVVLLCSITFTSSAQQTRTDAFHDAYALQQVVVLSRHNIRSPLSGPDSALGRITPHKWFQWSSAPSELSLRGGVLETMMGHFSGSGRSAKDSSRITHSPMRQRCASMPTPCNVPSPRLGISPPVCFL